VDEAVGGTRVGARSEKRNPEDFALWKKAEPEHIMRWPSPWGDGFPGWHVECSAMSMKYLGEIFDIHGGGLDNQFPHHECEIAQSVCATGHPFARYWIHNNLVTVNGQKMSKSLGNFTTLKDLFKIFHPLVVRFFILQSHYRSTLDFSEQAMQGAKAGFERLQNTVKVVRQSMSAPVSGAPAFDATPYRNRIVEALNDDLNTPQAIAVLFDLSKEINGRLAAGGMSSEGLAAADELFRTLGGSVLGIIPERMAAQSEAGGGDEAKIMQLLIDLRNEARASKNFQVSDRIRDGLKSIGIVLEDRKDGTGWKRG
jgi:cysteinyl-tRNA synthetase